MGNLQSFSTTRDSILSVYSAFQRDEATPQSTTLQRFFGFCLHALIVVAHYAQSKN
ncbi:hypothetical protein EVA_07846 [gut metagenome]|uniref:Uncharacterized protein n=1 Tax=gut metagenome TaxID=749906 RepID=J9GUF4_9ZZZZ